MAAITSIRISDPKKKRVVATAATGEFLSASGHPSQLIAVNVANVAGEAMPEKFSYNIAANNGAQVITAMNMQLDHTQDSTGGKLYVFYELV